MKSFKAIFRRGQNPKLEGDDISRTSSVTNLEVEQKNSKGAKPRKTSSRDRIDKIADGKKNEKKGLGKNNNKLDSTEAPFLSLDPNLEEDVQQLKKQLQEMAEEKTDLALQLGEKNGQVSFLQKENYKLKSLQEECNLQLEKLVEDNTALRNRLRDVAHSPLSDNEKQQLLFESHRHHNSAPASIATNILDDGTGADTACTTPDWDKHSSGNISEVSVACLQDKINQMQETHYSTNEELQATLQELTDLQMQLTELRQENERLNDEKTLMFDSLCRQTERLNDSREEVENLKQHLYQEKDRGELEAAAEREQKLLGMLHDGQEERGSLLAKIDQLTAELHSVGEGVADKTERLEQAKERVQTLECALDAKHAEHKQLEQELTQARDQCSGKLIEINRLTDLLDNARTKIVELEQDRTLSDKSELDELLDNTRKEKDSLESEVAHLKEQLAISKNEIDKVKEQVSVLQEECKVIRNNAKTTQSDLEYKNEILLKEKNALTEKLQEFQEALNELQVESQCQLEDKRQLSAVLSETQRNLSEAERKHSKLEQEFEELKRTRDDENADWKTFQDDLLTSVRVANDFKTEAQQELQRLILENKSCRERERQLRAEIEKLKGSAVKKEDPTTSNMDLLLKRPNKTRDKSNKVYLPSNSKSSTGTLPKSPGKSSRRNKLKTLSLEEEALLKSLRSYNIDDNIPDSDLTEEQRVFKKLKIIFDDDSLKVKPVAPKAKNQLAISRPLLNSVLSNPKLQEVMRDPKVKTIDDMVAVTSSFDRTRAKSHDCGAGADRLSAIGRSFSSNHVDKLEDRGCRLYRSVEAEDLTREVALKAPSIVPSDSVSNKRYSDFSVVVNNSDGKVSFATLEEIVRTTPADTPESSLSNEQKFAQKLLHALEERKHTLRKNGAVKDLPISRPTVESVVSNAKLKEILLDPEVAVVQRRNSDVGSPPRSLASLRQSKSYDNIHFRFETSAKKQPSMASTSSETLSSGEFDVETGLTGPYDPNAFATARLKDLSSFHSSSDRKVGKLRIKAESDADSLTYHDTIALKKNKASANRQLTDEEGSSDLMGNTSQYLENANENRDTVAFPGRDSLIYNDTISKSRGTNPDNYQFASESPSFVTNTDNDIVHDDNASEFRVDEEIISYRGAILLETRLEESYEILNQQNATPINIGKSAEPQQQMITIMKQQETEYPNTDISTLDAVEDFSEYSEGGSVDAINYNSILKENRYGVVPPLPYRRIYKDVVKEIKAKYTLIEDQEDEPLENDSTEEGVDNSIDDFFKSTDVTRSDSVLLRKNSADKIDEDMEYIFSKYLNTRVSGIIKESEPKRELELENNQGDLVMKTDPVPRPRHFEMQLDIALENTDDTKKEAIIKNENFDENLHPIVDNSTVGLIEQTKKADLEEYKTTNEEAINEHVIKNEELHSTVDNYAIKFIPNVEEENDIMRKKVTNEKAIKNEIFNEIHSMVDNSTLESIQEVKEADIFSDGYEVMKREATNEIVIENENFSKKLYPIDENSTMKLVQEAETDKCSDENYITSDEATKELITNNENFKDASHSKVVDISSKANDIWKEATNDNAILNESYHDESYSIDESITMKSVQEAKEEDNYIIRGEATNEIIIDNENVDIRPIEEYHTIKLVQEVKETDISPEETSEIIIKDKLAADESQSIVDNTIVNFIEEIAAENMSFVEIEEEVSNDIAIDGNSNEELHSTKNSELVEEGKQIENCEKIKLFQISEKADISFEDNDINVEGTHEIVIEPEKSGLESNVIVDNLAKVEHLSNAIVVKSVEAPNYIIESFTPVKEDKHKSETVGSNLIEDKLLEVGGDDDQLTKSSSNSSSTFLQKEEDLTSDIFDKVEKLESSTVVNDSNSKDNSKKLDDNDESPSIHNFNNSENTTIEDMKNIDLQQKISSNPLSDDNVEQGLTIDEVKLVKRIKQQRSERPISEINETDLQFIKDMSSSYFSEPSLQNIQGEELGEPLDGYVIAEPSVTVDNLEESRKIDESETNENVLAAKKGIDDKETSVDYPSKIIDSSADTYFVASIEYPSVEMYKNKIDTRPQKIEGEEIKTESDGADDLDAILKRLAPTTKTRAIGRRSRIQNTEWQPHSKESINVTSHVVKTSSISENKSVDSLAADEVVLRPKLSVPAFKSTTRSVVMKERPRSGTRRVKSFAQHFENLSLESKKKRGPVSTDLRPSKNQAVRATVTSTDNSPVTDDRLAVGKMNEDDKLVVVDGHDDVVGPEKSVFEVSGSRLVPPSEEPDAKMEKTAEAESVVETVVGEIGSETPAAEKVQFDAEDQACGSSKPQQSLSSIEISEKFEKLDLTRRSLDLDTISDGNASDLNLFHLDAASSFDESYLNLFKTPEEKAFDAFTKKKKKKPKKEYLDTGSDVESLDDNEHQKPKIVDFVPLDEATRPMFAKEPTEYDTLERESTYQVLRSVPPEAREAKEVKRSSFSDAKKVFEALQAQADASREMSSGSLTKGSVKGSKSIEKIEEK